MAIEIYTLTEAKDYLKEAHDSRKRTLDMLKYSVGSGEQEVERTNLKIINEDITKWEKVVRRLSNNRRNPRIKLGVPIG